MERSSSATSVFNKLKVEPPNLEVKVEALRSPLSYLPTRPSGGRCGMESCSYLSLMTMLHI
jgi:hypothetical protein